MSVEALRQVFADRSSVPASVQAVLVALAWRTPPGSDSTWPVSYRELSYLTHQSVSTVGKNVRRGIELGVLEVVWSVDGLAGRYRVNRGDWHVPGGEIQKLAVEKPVEADQGQFVLEPDQYQNDTGTGVESTPDPFRIGTPCKKKNEEEDDRALSLVDLAEPDPDFVARFEHHWVTS